LGYFHISQWLGNIQPAEVPVVDKPMLEKPPIPSSDRLILLSKETYDKAALDEPMFE
jgi:hypothetical protein